MFYICSMNTHSKLREIGFKRTTFHKPNEFLDGANMLPDNTERRWVLGKDGSRVCIETPKIHPKSNSFWKLNFSERYTIWVSVVSNNIDKIWLDDKEIVRLRGYSNESCLKTIYTYRDIKITSKRQIINLLPADIKRDFIIRDLLK